MLTNSRFRWQTKPFLQLTSQIWNTLCKLGGYKHFWLLNIQDWILDKSLLYRLIIVLINSQVLMAGFYREVTTTTCMTVSFWSQRNRYLRKLFLKNKYNCSGFLWFDMWIGTILFVPFKAIWRRSICTLQSHLVR